MHLLRIVHKDKLCILIIVAPSCIWIDDAALLDLEKRWDFKTEVPDPKVNSKKSVAGPEKKHCQQTDPTKQPIQRNFSKPEASIGKM